MASRLTSSSSTRTGLPAGKANYEQERGIIRQRREKGRSGGREGEKGGSESKGVGKGGV